MSTSARAADPSMEEILASIRRIIADDMPPRREASGAVHLPAVEEDEREIAAPASVAAPAVRPSQPVPPDPVPLRPPPREPSLFAEHAAAEPPAATQTVPSQFLDLDAVGDEIEAEVALALRRRIDADPPAAQPAFEDEHDGDGRDPAPAAGPSRPLPSFAPPPASFRTGATPAAGPSAAAPPPRTNFSFGQSARPASPYAAAGPTPLGTPPSSERLVSAPTNAAVAASFGTLARTIMSGNNRSLEDVVGELLKPMLRSWLDDNLPNIVERLVKAEIERVSRGGR